MPSETDEECHFFKIPPEVRNSIYQDVLSTVDFEELDGSVDITDPPLLDTCELIRKEVAPLYHDRLTKLSIRNVEEATRISIQRKSLLDELHNFNFNFFAALMRVRWTRFLATSTETCASRAELITEKMNKLKQKTGGNLSSERSRSKLVEARDRFMDVNKDILDE